MRPGLLALALVVGLAIAVAPPRADPVPSAGHYIPHPGDAFTFRETIAVNGGTGNYSGYTEVDAIVGTLNVTAVLPNGTETAAYNYSGDYSNSDGVSYPWLDHGTFTFSATTFDYVRGTDNQTGENGSEQWFYLNNSLGVGAEIDPLGTPMTVESVVTSYPLETAAGTYVTTMYADGTGVYERDDSYGLFSATYDWRAYFDPGTGYVVGYNYTELDSDGHGNGFVYTDDLEVTKTTYPLTAAPRPAGYAVTFTEAGLASGTSWTVTFDGTAYTGSGPSLTVPSVENGTYLYGVSAAGYSINPAVRFVTVSGGSPTTSQLIFAAAPTASGNAVLLDIEVAVAVLVVLVVVIVLVYALARRARRSAPLPKHSVGGRPQYGPMPPGPAPPPISLGPRDQPQIQQVVVKEVVKVNCRYCGSLIDATAEKCPFCGATRT